MWLPAVFGAMTSRWAIWRTLAGVVRSQDFVWGALGRFALPATGLLPPGILGHDAGRRRTLLPVDDAKALQTESLVEVRQVLRFEIVVAEAGHPPLRATALGPVFHRLGFTCDVALEKSPLVDLLEMPKAGAGQVIGFRRIGARNPDPGKCPFRPGMRAEQRKGIVMSAFQQGIDGAQRGPHKMPQMAVAYSRMVRSEENQPLHPEVVFQVRDEGIGITPEEQLLIFEKFYQSQVVEIILQIGVAVGADAIVVRH